jgi:cytochrome P450
MHSSLAYAEMKLVLARIIYDFDFELVDPHDDWFDQKVFTLWDKKPLLLKFKEKIQ